MAWLRVLRTPGSGVSLARDNRSKWRWQPDTDEHWTFRSLVHCDLRA